MLALAVLVACAQSQTALVKPHPTILLLSDTKGFVHDCIPTAREAISKYFSTQGCKVVPVTAADFEQSSKALAGADVVMFVCTTGEVLGPKGKAWLEGFVRGGGGYVGIHSATDTHYEWPFYGRLVGAYFKTHPAIQDAKVKIEDRAHPSTIELPPVWTRTDEWYDFRENPRPNVRVLATLDESTYKNGGMGADHPIMWCQEFEGGRSWYTEMGHTKETYAEEAFLASLYQGALWTAQVGKPKGAVSIEWTNSGTWKQTADGLDNGGNAPHLVSKKSYGDAWVHAEFKIPKGSNSGVYLQGRYEIQVLDSFGKPDADLQFSDAGGVYQRWKDEKGYEGVPPRHNAIRAPDEWNTYDILFQAPKFDRSGKKIASAKFVEVRVNGVIVQKDVVVSGPTRASMWEDEKATGPVMLQGDHGPIVYRNVWIAPSR